MAVELRNALVSSLDSQLPPTMVLDYPTLRTLTDFLLKEICHEQDMRDQEAPIPDDITNMTDEEAEQLLLAELGRRQYGA
jgi:hypothetical protein